MEGNFVSAKAIEPSLVISPEQLPSSPPKPNWISWKEISAGAILGILLGSAAGFSLAVMTVPNRTEQVAEQSTQPASQPASTNQTAATGSPLAEKMEDAAPILPEAQLLPGATEQQPVSLPMKRASSKRKTVAHKIAVQPVPESVNDSAEAVLTSGLSAAPDRNAVPGPIPAALDTAKISTFYVEGFIRVLDYDATAGTIETNDGRTFLVGPTLNADASTNWVGQPVSLHYRCGQDGSCVLNRAGMVLANVRQI
jgi:hypothetical protein